MIIMFIENSLAIQKVQCNLYMFLYPIHLCVTNHDEGPGYKEESQAYGKTVRNKNKENQYT